MPQQHSEVFMSQEYAQELSRWRQGGGYGYIFALTSTVIAKENNRICRCSAVVYGYSTDHGTTTKIT